MKNPSLVALIRMRRFFILVLSACTLAACQSTTSQTTQLFRETVPGLPRVLAVESFLADIVQNVAGDRLTVEALLPVGVDPHAYQPEPQDVVHLTDANVLIINGAHLEAFLDPVLQNVGGVRQVIIASAGLVPRPDPQGEHPEGDPHFWLDPNNVIKYVENIRDGLSQADPPGAPIYTVNAAAYIEQLKSLDQWITGQVSVIRPEHRLMVTNHESFGYFAARYGFRVVGAVIPSVSSEASPTAQQMVALIIQIRSSGAPAIFLEVGANSNLADQIAADTGAKVFTDLYTHSLSVPDGPAPTYLEMMKYNVIQIVEALK